MGEAIKGSGKPYVGRDKEMWQEATRAVLRIAGDVGIKPAIVGSFAHQSMVGRELDAVVDLDVFLMGSEDLRQRFREKAETVWRPEYPDLDTPNLLHVSQLVFDREGNASFQYGRRKFTVHPSVFATYPVEIEGTKFPVLHPKTSLKLIALPPRYTKTGRVDILKEVALQWEKRPDISDPDMAALDELERLIRRNPLWSLREWFYEAEKRGEWFVKPKENFRERFPKVAGLMRKIVSR